MLIPIVICCILFVSVLLVVGGTRHPDPLPYFHALPAGRPLSLSEMRLAKAAAYERAGKREPTSILIGYELCSRYVAMMGGSTFDGVAMQRTNLVPAGEIHWLCGAHTVAIQAGLSETAPAQAVYLVA